MKCCQNGELSGRRRTVSAMGYPHPLRHIGCPPLCSNDTRSGETVGQFCAALPPMGVMSILLLPLRVTRKGFLFGHTIGAVPGLQAFAHNKKEAFL